MSNCIYPDDEWGDGFKLALDAPIKYLPSDWRQYIKLAPPPTETDECSELVEIIKKRPKHRADIIAQAQSRVEAIQPVLALARLYKPPVKSRTIDLVYAVLDDILAPTFILKKEYMRGRPRQCCEQNLDPMFRKTPLDPLHPSYPSGHSAQAHAAAEVLALLSPEMADDLRKAADEVARNREIAGLHYPSDSAAGAELARQLLALLRPAPTFIAELEKARLEW